MAGLSPLSLAQTPSAPEPRGIRLLSASPQHLRDPRPGPCEELGQLSSVPSLSAVKHGLEEGFAVWLPLGRRLGRKLSEGLARSERMTQSPAAHTSVHPCRPADAEANVEWRRRSSDSEGTQGPPRR